METKICSQCKRELPLSEYYTSGKNRYRAECKSCHNAYVKKSYHTNQKMLASIKGNVGCQKCGDKREYVLDFHHTDPNIKDAEVSRLLSSNATYTRFLDEVDKCIILCANCHREFHYLQIKDGISLEEYLSSK